MSSQRMLLTCLALGLVHGSITACAKDIVIGEQFPADAGHPEYDGTESDSHSSDARETGNYGNGGETARRGTLNDNAEEGATAPPIPSQPNAETTTPRPQGTAYEASTQPGSGFSPDAGALDSQSSH